jgi:hypothetical protein
MNSSKTLALPARLLTSVAVGFMLVAGLSLAQAEPSHADLSVGIEDGAGTGGSPISGNDNITPSLPAPGGGGGGGGGSSMPAGSFWVYSWGANSACSPKANAGPAIGIRVLWITQEATTPSRDQQPAGGGWRFSAYFPGYGAHWTRVTPSPQMNCIYPPTYKLVTQECVLGTNARFDEIRPSPDLLAQGSGSSGYNQGNPDPARCAASRSHVALGANIIRYSYVEGTAVSQAVTHTFKIYLEADPRTGAVPATEIVGTVGPYNLPAKRNSASITCKGSSIPGDDKERDFTEASCSKEKTSSPSYVCNANPVLYDVASVGEKERMQSFPGDVFDPYSTWESGNPGRKIMFNQNPSGEGITVNSFSTSYEVTSTTPGQYFQLGLVGSNGKIDKEDILVKQDAEVGTYSTGDATYQGKRDTVNIIVNGVSTDNGSLSITQILKWSGTKRVQTIHVTGLNPITGDITYTLGTADVPTSGVCRSTAQIGVIHAING